MSGRYPLANARGKATWSLAAPLANDSLNVKLLDLNLDLSARWMGRLQKRIEVWRKKEGKDHEHGEIIVS